MKIVFHKKFQKAFSRQPKSIQAKFKIAIQQFSEDEFHHSLNNHSLNNHALRGKYNMLRSIDITGDIRVHYKKEEDVVVLVNMGTHSQLY